MPNLRLDLSNYPLFEDGNLIIDKRISFIFGKNGTGKSTLTSIIKDQARDYDLNIFQGFDGVVGENHKLNAVVLGEENNKIDQEINNIEMEIQNKNLRIEDIKNDIEENDQDTNNFWSVWIDAKQNYENLSSKFNKFYTKSAKIIKNQNNPNVAVPTYNNPKFKSDISSARILPQDEINKYKRLLKTDEKAAKHISYLNINFNELYNKTNDILSKKVVEKEEIIEISNNHEKRKFAEEGLKIHEPEEVCAFCGSIVRKERYEKLLRYFSADEVISFKSEINQHIKIIESYINKLSTIEINLDDFYPEFYTEINYLKDKISINTNTYIKILSYLRDTMKEKSKDIFSSSPTIDMRLPENIDDTIKLYNDCVNENNSNNLSLKKEEAKENLRLHYVREHLNKFDYKNKLKNLNNLKLDYENKNTILISKKQEIIKLQDEINNLKNSIQILHSKTRSEKILADKINDKLYLYVNFKLKYVEDSDSKGYYKICSILDNKIRDITELSTGEKNIIAFLYFTHKLRDIYNPNNSLDKLVVFDDPMTSNDDTMQYLIIEEINRIIKEDIKKNDKIIVLTHNNHFYLNVKYKYESYKKNKFIRLESNGKQSKIRLLSNREEDFKTNYEALWQELIFIYENAPSESMLLNPIRRIIETFTKFNGIVKSEMLSKVPGSEKLFNVNSHSIDDLEAELNGKSKDEIMRMMRVCFEKEQSISHFNKYWNIEID